MIRILGLDTANKQTGWAIRERIDGNDRCIKHGTITPPSSMNVTEKNEFVRQQLMPIMQQRLTAVVMERTFVQGSGDTTRGLCELQGVLKNILHRMGHRVYEPSPSTWRAIVPGNGRADKRAIDEWCGLREYHCESIDEMEACAIAMSYGEKLIETLTRKDREKQAKKEAKERERREKQAAKELERQMKKAANSKR